MPHKDRHKKRLIPIEFDFCDCLKNLPMKNRLSITLISNGSVTLKINNCSQKLKAPSLLCCSPNDTIHIISIEDMSAKTFYFDPWYIKACLKFDNLTPDTPVEPGYEHHKMMLINLFLSHNTIYNGSYELSPANYLHINENLSLIGAETYSQSDSYWTCRIRRLLVATLNCINDLYVDQRKLKFFEQQYATPIVKCMDYIHKNYQNDISLKELCQVANLNRTSLNDSFKGIVGYTIIDYLNNYRIQISCELLSHTAMSIDEISQTCGFKYSSYFLKQFKNRMGKTPGQFKSEFLKSSKK